MINKVLKTIEKYQLIKDEDKIVVRRIRGAGLYLPFTRVTRNTKTKKDQI